MVGFAAWATSRRAIQDDCIVVECSDRYDGTILIELFDDMYIVEPMKLCATYLGACARRVRFWAVMIHRTKVVLKWSSLANVIPLFERGFNGTFWAA